MCTLLWNSHFSSVRTQIKRAAYETKCRCWCNCIRPGRAASAQSVSKGRYTLPVKLSDFTLWRHTWRKNRVNCAVLTGNSAGLRTVLSSRLSHTELRSPLKESHSFLSLPADTTMASPQDTYVSINSFSRWSSHDTFLFKYQFLLHILLFLSLLFG